VKTQKASNSTWEIWVALLGILKGEGVGEAEHLLMRGLIESKGGAAEVVNSRRSRKWLGKAEGHICAAG
jgi:hypothetical protein